MTNKITSINQTGGIIAEEVNVTGIKKTDFVDDIQMMIATLKSEGYIVYSPEQWQEIQSWILNARKQYKDYPISEMILNEVEIVLEVK